MRLSPQKRQQQALGAVAGGASVDGASAAVRATNAYPKPYTVRT